MTEPHKTELDDKTRWMDFILPVVLFVLHGMFYNPIGNVAASRGVDYGPLLNTPLDSMVPLSVVFIIPYTALWALPIAMLVMLSRRASVTPADIRRFSVGFGSLMGVCYLLWIAFPMQVTLRADEETLTSLGWMGSFTWLTYQNASMWNCCPSFHVASPWFVCRIMWMYCDKVPIWVRVLTVGVIMATVFIRIHYLLDIVGGILVSEGVYRFVLVPLQKRRALEGISRTQVVCFAIALGLAGVGVVLLLGRFFPPIGLPG